MRRWLIKYLSLHLYFVFILGSVKTGMDYYNSNRNMNERFGQMFLLNGKIKTQTIICNIAGVVKLKDTHTGNTLLLWAPKTRFTKSKYSFGYSTPKEDGCVFCTKHAI